LEDINFATTQYFKDIGDVIILLGKPSDTIDGSEYLAVEYNRIAGHAPRVDFEYEKKIQDICYEAIREGLIKSAHDCSEGGLAVALAESCFNPRGLLGVNIEMEITYRPDIELFGESHSRIIVSLEEKEIPSLIKIIKKYDSPYQILGKVTGQKFQINELISCDTNKLYDLWYNAIQRKMDSVT
ncbi:MAG: hypothetical protein B1H05_03695, partial [Candidatus Cloacimonas sp. 4484_140]